MTAFLLVPSPLLGPATWRPVEAWLHEQGHAATTVDFGSELRAPEQVLDAIARAAPSGPVTLVPHSNAGLYAPQLATLLEVERTVHVDAALPADDGPETRLALEEFLGFLRDLVEPDGRLPRWTDWWLDIAERFPDDITFETVAAEQQRLPLSYFTSSVPVPRGWAERPAAYLAFGDTYAAELRLAQEAGWPTATLDGGHLHQLVDPGAVGAAILGLVDRTDSVGGAH
ncbi:alpha/beta hydrolase [Aeromicrobium sp. Marseille-Q0843]|uniref:Alpha/beta hydrolase n=1 Tax=Aeromicrobium phoceense TaxID=2754045 RepID=A0A838XJV7_9ACTN|nr:alpha/beta hydrolase [Aeromicrobium phoceense]MBA4608906.1 alpha/beta hydrolase [Aeromicrobium phoceense]